MSQVPDQINMANVVVVSVEAALKTSLHLIEKAQEYAKEKNAKEETILGLRLIADMFPFVKQIQIVTDNAKGAFARLSGGTVPVFEDTEATFEELKARIIKTQEYIRSVDVSTIVGTEQKEIVLKFGELVMPFVGFSYLIGYLIPNMNFHLTTAYNILRSNGVTLGKSDYFAR